MKHKIIYLLAFVVLCSCNKKEGAHFDADMSQVQVSFEAYPGGAIMRYSLPNNSDIYAIQAKYKDFNGKDITIKGTYTGREAKLFGFNKATENIPVEINLIDHENRGSDAISKSFSTLDSAPYEVMENITVTEGWNGFRVRYSGLTDYTDGMMNIYYVGVNPNTQNIDTLVVGTYPLQTGTFTFDYTDLPDTCTTSTVVVKTQDFRGNIVRKEVYPDVPIAFAEELNTKDVDLIGGSSIEDDNRKLGWNYLFDGDVRGKACLKGGLDTKFYSFMSEKGMVYTENDVWTFDLKENHTLAWIRIYSHIAAMVQSSRGSKGPMKSQAQWIYPNSLVVYGTNNPDANIDDCTRLGSYSESQSLPEESKWIARSIDEATEYTTDQMDLFMAEEPNYLQVNFSADQTEKYRYLKIRVLETFQWYSYNGSLGKQTGALAMEELGIFTKKTTK